MKDFKFNPLYSSKSAILCSVRPFDQLRFVPSDVPDESLENPEDGISYTLVSDTFLLLNSERIIDTLGEDVYRALVNSMVPSKSPYQDQKIPDSQLFMVKPRNCQEHSELRAWSQYIMSCMSDLRTSVEKAAAEKAAAEKAAAEKAAAESSEITNAE